MDRVGEEKFDFAIFQGAFKDLLEKISAAQFKQGFSTQNLATYEERVAAQEEEKRTYQRAVQLVVISMSQVDALDRAIIVDTVESCWCRQCSGNISGILAKFWSDVAIAAFEV